MIRILLTGLLLGAIGVSLLRSEPAGRTSMTLRGQQQEIYVYPAAGSGGVHNGQVLFLPGDGGLRGFAVDMAKGIATQGYDVYGWDIKKYLMGFTSGKTTLSESQMMADIQEVAKWMLQGKGGKVLLSGWSQGAAMVVLAAAATQRESIYQGVVAIGLPKSAVLGWRTIDDLTYITKKDPNEPTFSVLPRLSQLEPLPLALIFSTSDEYITGQEAKSLYEAARDPKRYFEVTARNHSFGGNQNDFFRTLGEAFRWVSLH